MQERKTAPRQSQTRGSALIVVLWTIGLMALLVSSFAFDAHLEARVTSYYKKRTRAGYLAQSGMEIAKVLMAKSAKINPNGEPDPNNKDRWYADARSLASGGALHIQYELGEGTVNLDIVTEQARRNVNLLKKEEEWEPILDAIGVPMEFWPDLIDPFMDWIDADDEPRPDGAEGNDYYEGLDPPYKARNGDLYSVEELLLIKGFNRGIVYGGPMDPESEDPIMIDAGGLSRLLTVFGDPKINVNAASADVLMTLPSTRGDNDLVADAIFEEREATTNYDGTIQDNYFKDDADLFRRVPQMSDPERSAYVSTASSKYFRITSRGRVQNVDRTVWCIVQNEGTDLKILRWVEEE